MNEIEERWRKTGLLDGQEGFDASLLAGFLEDAAQVLWNRAEPGSFVTLAKKAGFFLPIIVRLFNERGVRILNADKLYTVFDEFYDKYNDVFELDEAEFCHCFVETSDPSEFMF